MSSKKGKLLQIAELGQSIIREKCLDVKNVKDKDIQSLIEDMIATVKEVDGVGIAANQVYENLRLFIIASHPSKRYPKAPNMVPTAMINPTLVSHTKAQEKDWEGCLSIPGVRGNVPRFKEIEVEFTAKDGVRKKKTLKTFLARIFQHEYDHLEGEVYLERLESTKDIITEKEFQKMVKKDGAKKKKSKKEKLIKL